MFLSATLGLTEPTTQTYKGVQPVEVGSCSLSPQLSTLSESYFGGIAGVATLNISFVNRSPKTVSRVEFAVNDGQAAAQIDDAGTFSTGVAVNHTYSAPALMRSNVSCTGTFRRLRRWQHLARPVIRIP
jgi:hypothetical protein